MYGMIYLYVENLIHINIRYEGTHYTDPISYYKICNKGFINSTTKLHFFLTLFLSLNSFTLKFSLPSKEDLCKSNR